jgi:hypothetical protein
MHIQVYKTNPQYNNIYLALYLLLCCTGLAGIVAMFFLGKTFASFFNEASYFLLLFNGLLGIFIIQKNKFNRKYFVAWDDHEISYHLPKSKTPETIKIEDIKSINKSIGKVDIALWNGGIKQFNLNHFFFPERKIICEYFENNLNKVSTN